MRNKEIEEVQSQCRFTYAARSIARLYYSNVSYAREEFHVGGDTKRAARHGGAMRSTREDREREREYYQ